MGWKWETGTPLERGNAVRNHQRFGLEVVCKLFCLTPAGARAIFEGEAWRPEHSTMRSGGMKDALGDTPYEQRYPLAPGFKERTTSRDAAKAIASNTAILREQVYGAFLAAGPEGATADEVAALLNRSVLSVRPRVSELAKAEPPRIEATGKRRKNESTMSAKVWRAA